MPRRFKIIYVSTSRLHRNRANLIQTLHTVAAFHGLGLSARLEAPPWRGRLDARLEALGIDVPLDVRAARLLHSRWRRFGYWPFVQWYKMRLKAADALYTRTPELSLALVRAGLPHHLEIHDTRDLMRFGMLEPIVAAHRVGLIDWLLPISRAAASVLIDAGAIAERMHVCPSGVDIDVYAGIPAFDPARLDRPRIAYLGRVSASRGLDIFRAVAASGRADVTLIGEQEESVTSGPNLTIVPPVPHREVPRRYGDSDLVLLPYRRDLGHADSISPIKLFEAMAAGRPIIAADIPPIREIVAHEDSALLVDPDHTQGWLDAIERLRADHALALRLASAALALAPRYSWRQRALGIARALGWPVAVASDVTAGKMADDGRR